MGCGLGLNLALGEKRESVKLETMTGYKIASPGDYWAALEKNYRTEGERERAQAYGLDHFGSYGVFGSWRCFRCGFLCEGEEGDE